LKKNIITIIKLLLVAVLIGGFICGFISGCLDYYKIYGLPEDISDLFELFMRGLLPSSMLFVICSITIIVILGIVYAICWIIDSSSSLIKSNERKEFKDVEAVKVVPGDTGMRLLIKCHETNTFETILISYACYEDDLTGVTEKDDYDSQTGKKIGGFFAISIDGDNMEIRNITPEICNSIIKELYESGKADLSCYEVLW